MRTLSADVGGTFTDLVLIDSETGKTYLDKIASTPGRPDAIIDGIRRITSESNLLPRDIDLFVHGFTVATNAMITRKGARVAMVVTQGFRDILEIGDQMRPHLYHLTQYKAPPVVPRSRIVEVEERLDAFGKVVNPLQGADADRVAAELAELAPDVIAVCLNFAFLNITHEKMIEAAIARKLPGVPVYLSSNINPQLGEYQRANTTAIAAYIGPVVDRYIARLEQSLTDEGIQAPLRLIRSDGGVATPRVAKENPATMLLSGPAGGVIAGACVATEYGVSDLVTFDMGGTSADFSIIRDCEPRMVTEREIDGQPVRLPTLDIETISAGGGSIAHVDLGGGLKVGPQSAGAEPGPACYGIGGVKATVTDAAVVLGILVPEMFLAGEMPIDIELARKAVALSVASPMGIAIEAAALGIIRVACNEMIQAIRKLSVERGLDVRDFALLAFGGAGPIYAPYLARDLDMNEILVPPNPGVFAAQGLLMSDIRHTTQMSFQRRLCDITEDELSVRLGELLEKLNDALELDGIDEEDRYFRFSADMRCVGQFHELTVPLDEPGAPNWWSTDATAARFHAHHEQMYGHTDAQVPVELLNLRLEGFGRTDRAALPENESNTDSAPTPAWEHPVYLDAATGFQPCPFYKRADLSPGQEITGPAIIVQRDTTTLVLDKQCAKIVHGGLIRIKTGEQS